MGTDELRVVIERRDPEDPHWYALRVVPQKEYTVAYLLRRQGVRTFVPTETRWRKRTRYQKSKAEFASPEIPGCVFAAFDGAPSWYHLVRNSLIVGVEGRDGKPWRLQIESTKDRPGLFEFFAHSVDGCLVLDEGKALIHVQGRGILRPPTTRVRTISKRRQTEAVVVEPTGRRARILSQFVLPQPEPVRAAA